MKPRPSSYRVLGVATGEELLTLIPRFKGLLNVHAGSLSGGERKMLGIARAMMAKHLRVMFLYEPTAGLAPGSMATVLEFLKQVRDDGKGILLVEQNVDVALAISDKACVLVGGKIRWFGECAEVGSRTDLFNMFLAY